MKLLSPVGNFDSLKLAIQNGADEVYLGINEFNARNNIDGFTMETLENAVDYAHLFNVKVLLAINILFTDEEINSAIQVVIKAYNLGVDAFIMQDLGLISAISKTYPEIEIHASTQMGIHNLEGVLALEKYGIKRVVLARETPLSEIKRIKENSNVEIEYFVHGALCVCFSGNCYLSSYLFNASGNRGKCKQPCRLSYTLRFNGKALKKGYLLSVKDFNMSKRLNDLKDVGVDVLKIEGRARRPYYVGVATREYAKALKNLNANQIELEKAFNRGFTEGYFNGNGDIISENQNHIGIPLGKIIKVSIGKKFNTFDVVSNAPIKPKSVLKFFDGKTELATITAFDIKSLGNKIYRITTTQKVYENAIVRLISNLDDEKEILSNIDKPSIEVSILANEKKPLLAKTIIDGNVLEIKGDILEPSKNCPITEKDLIDCFLKSENYKVNVKIESLDNVFISKSKLNEFRRLTFKLIYEKSLEKYKRNLSFEKVETNKDAKPILGFTFVAEPTFNASENVVIYSPEVYELENVKVFVDNCIKIGKKAYLDTPNFAIKNDIELLKEIVSKTGIGVVANNYYALNLSKNAIIGGGLNVYNTLTANEHNLPFIKSEGEDKTEFSYMTLKHCPIKQHVGGSCDNCKYKNGYEYLMDNGKVLKLKRKKLTGCTFYLN